MTKPRYLLLLVAFLILTGCASSAVVQKPMTEPVIQGDTRYQIGNVIDRTERGVPDHFLEALKGYINSELRSRRLLATETRDGNREVNITVTYYRMRSGANRLLWGAMAGKDGLRSTVTVVDRRTGQVIGESEVDTYSVMAVTSENDIARMHGEEIAKFLTGGR